MFFWDFGIIYDNKGLNLGYGLGYIPSLPSQHPKTSQPTSQANLVCFV